MIAMRKPALRLPSPRGLAGALAAVALLLATPSARADGGGWFPPDGAGQAPAAPAASADDVQAAPSDDYADNDPSALTDFRAPLAPYGTWTDDPTYGTLWVPDATQVGQDFAPYQTAGSWGVTNGGDWLWQSDYSWGYIPFHYGRWVWTGATWGWIPGRVYSPAWVAWRVGEGGYLGWAPLPPAYGWRGGRAVGLAAGRAPFCFVPVNYAFLPGVSAYVVRDRGMIAAIAGSTHSFRGGYGGRSSPTLSEAHVPASAAPHGVARADGRSLAYSTRSATAATRAGRAYNPGGYGVRASGGGVSSYRAERGIVIGRSEGYGRGEAYGRGEVYGRESFGGHEGVTRAYGAGRPIGARPAAPPAYRPPSAPAPTASHSVSHGGGHRR